jgi:hypothetical protein
MKSNDREKNLYISVYQFFFYLISFYDKWSLIKTAAANFDIFVFGRHSGKYAQVLKMDLDREH